MLTQLSSPNDVAAVEVVPKNRGHTCFIVWRCGCRLSTWLELDEADLRWVFRQLASFLDQLDELDCPRTNSTLELCH